MKNITIIALLSSLTFSMHGMEWISPSREIRTKESVPSLQKQCLLALRKYFILDLTLPTTKLNPLESQQFIRQAMAQLLSHNISATEIIRILPKNTSHENLINPPGNLDNQNEWHKIVMAHAYLFKNSENLILSLLNHVIANTDAMNVQDIVRSCAPGTRRRTKKKLENQNPDDLRLPYLDATLSMSLKGQEQQRREEARNLPIQQPVNPRVRRVLNFNEAK